MDRKRNAVIKKTQTKKGVVGINFRQPKRLAQPYIELHSCTSMTAGPLCVAFGFLVFLPGLIHPFLHKG